MADVKRLLPYRLQTSGNGIFVMCPSLWSVLRYIDGLKPFAKVFKRSTMKGCIGVINNRTPNSKCGFLHYAVLHLRADFFSNKHVLRPTLKIYFYRVIKLIRKLRLLEKPAKEIESNPRWKHAICVLF